MAYRILTTEEPVAGLRSAHPMCLGEEQQHNKKKRFHMLCVCSLALFSFSSRSRTNTLSQGKAGDTAERPLGSNRALEEDSVEQTRIARVLYLF